MLRPAMNALWFVETMVLKCGASRRENAFMHSFATRWMRLIGR